MQEMQFDFFRGMEAKQYTFYRIPKILFTAECFRPLSCEAKVLYGLLLDRMSLSIKNRWLDEENRVYIVFKVEEITELMNCGTQKAVKLLKELDVEKGIGLIEKKRLGLGKPNVIYVKNFIIRQTGGGDTEKEYGKKQPNTQNCEIQNSGAMKETGREITKQQFHNNGDSDTGTSGDLCQENIESKPRNNKVQDLKTVKTVNAEFSASQIQNCENQKLGMVNITIPEIPKPQTQNYEYLKLGIMNITIPDFPKSQSNNTDISESEYSETDLKETESGREECIHSNLIRFNPSIPDKTSDVIERMDACRDVIRENISYESFQDERYHRIGEVDELVELMVEVMQLPDDSVLRIAGTEKLAAVVKSRFMKLNQGHMEYIMSCLTANTKKVGNIKAYLLTVLYNATLTVNNYYTAEVAHATC